MAANERGRVVTPRAQKSMSSPTANRATFDCGPRSTPKTAEVKNSKVIFHCECSSISLFKQGESMARLSRKEWYRRCNAAWPDVVPPLTADEATRAARRLYRFATGRTWRGDVVITSGNRYTWIRGGRLIVNPEQGWREVVHLLSHALEGYAGTHGHTAAHARFEMRMIKEVVRRGWLDGKLKTPERPAAIAPSKDAERAAKIARTLAAIKRWETKAKRADTALRKLHRRRRALERAALTLSA